MNCPGENVTPYGLLWRCCDVRKDACDSVNIVTDGNHVEIYICQDPHPSEDK